MAAADHRERAASILVVILVTLNSGFAVYQSRADMQSTLLIALTYIDLVLLLVWRRLASHGRRPSPGKDHGRLVAAARVLEVSVICLTMLLIYILLASQLPRILPPQTSELLLLVAAAIAGALAACFLFLLYKFGWFIDPPSNEANLPLVQPLPKH